MQNDGKIPDTTIKGATYVNCDKPEVCEAGAHRSYRMQAVVRAYRVKGSHKIIIQTEVDPKPRPISKDKKDVVFHTRAFEALPGSKSQWGPDKAGGNGTLGMLGPVIVGNPGERVHLFVMNNLDDTSALGSGAPSKKDYYDRMDVSMG